MDEPTASHRPAPPLDLRRTPQSLGSAIDGYGLSPASARQRAAMVRAVTEDAGIRQRPMPVVVVTGLVALVAVAVWGWQLYLTITEEQPTTLLFWGALVTSLVASAICSWAWQLYDVRKAVVMWLAIVVLGIAAVLIIVLVMVALKGDGDDLDIDLGGLLDRITGSPDQGRTSFAGDLVAPLMVDAADGWGRGVAGPDDLSPRPEAEPEHLVGPADGPACPSCGRPITAGLLTCPRCGGPLA